MRRRDSRSGRKLISARAVFSQPGATPRPRVACRAPRWSLPPGGFHVPAPGVSLSCWQHTRISRPSRHAGNIACSQQT
eukprot:3779673-Amphidinium_carterae.1